MTGTSEVASLTSGGSAMRPRLLNKVRSYATRLTTPVTISATRAASSIGWTSALQGMGVLGLVTSTGLITAAAYASDAKNAPDIGPMCGTKPMIVGLSDGYGGNTWRKIAHAELKDELSHCPNVTRFIYSNANGDPQKANSDLNSMIAQGVNVLIIDPDFGPSQIPSMRSALKAGVTVVAYPTSLPGKPGRDYTVNIAYDMQGIGKLWTDWLGKTVKKGTVVFLGGTAGVTSSQNFFNGFKDGLKNYPDLQLLSDQYVVTNWNPVDAKKAAVGLIAKFGKIDAVVTDYGSTAIAVVRAFQEANLQPPAVATIASSNEINCQYLADKKAGKAWRYFSLDGTTSMIRTAGRRAVSEFQGTTNNEALSLIAFPYVDSEQNIDPKCDPSTPLDADLSSSLPPEKLLAVFK